MTEEEQRRAQQERDEANRLISRINSLTGQIDRASREKQTLEQELAQMTSKVHEMIGYAGQMDQAVNAAMGKLSRRVEELDVDTSSLFEALNELSNSYFLFKNISTASKNISQYTDEYYTKFSYYNELRRITLGYVIGLDSYICSSDTMRKKVETAYLQNTEYWLAYCISAVMLWASDEKEAAERAMNKSLSIHYFNSCLFYLLINLRFGRVDAAKQWYVNYLERVDLNELGDDWQYLLQAYLSGAFGVDAVFQEQVAKSFRELMQKMEEGHSEYVQKVTAKAVSFAETYLHQSEAEFVMLKQYCNEYSELRILLSEAEKNAILAKHYNQIAEQIVDEENHLEQRIENVLYSLINNYDDDELDIVMKRSYNEAVVKAKGDISAAQSHYYAMFADRAVRSSLDEQLMNWAFASDNSQTDITVRRFSISYIKEWIAEGFAQFASAYRSKEKEAYTITIDNCSLTCDENNYEASRVKLVHHYDKNKLRDTLKDKLVLIYIGACAASLLTLVAMNFFFSPAVLIIAVLLGLAGSFLLWRRIVDMKAILKEKKRKGVAAFKKTWDELNLWRKAYRDEDIRNADLLNAISRF